MKLGDSIKFVGFYNKIKDQQMPVLTAYKFLKIYKQAKEDESFYFEKVREILQQYGELDEQGQLIPTSDGSGVKIQPSKQEECIQKLNELQEIESTIEFEPINLALLKDFSLTPADIEGIINFLV